MEFGVIIAARLGSRRLPRKALLPLAGIPMIVFLIRRIRNSRLAGKIILATTDLPEDDELAGIVSREGIDIFRGSADDVVARYVAAAEKYNIQYVVRVTGDCPFVDRETLDYSLNYCSGLDYFDLASTKGLFPVGIDYEIYNTLTMRELHQKRQLSADDREHLTKYLYDHPGSFEIRKIPPPDRWDRPLLSFTVDTPADYAFARDLAERFNSVHFNLGRIIKVAEK